MKYTECYKYIFFSINKENDNIEPNKGIKQQEKINSSIIIEVFLSREPFQIPKIGKE